RPGAGHGDGQLLGARARTMSAQLAPAGRGEPMWRHWIVGGVASTVANLINGRSIETADRLAARASSPATLHSLQTRKLRRTPPLTVLPSTLSAPRRRSGERVAPGRAGRAVHDPSGSHRPSGGGLSLPASPGALRDQRHVSAPEDHLLLPPGGGVGDQPHG